MIVVDVKWNSGLYDYNPTTGELTKVLKCYRNDGSLEHYRMNYAYYEDCYKEATDEDINEYKYQYFNEHGELVFQ